MHNWANPQFDLYVCLPSSSNSVVFKGELTKKILFLFSLDQVSLISLLKYFPPKMSLT